MMKLLFLSKRRPMARDLLERPYGRFYHLPRIMAEQGHRVEVLLLDYHRGPNITREIDGMQVHSVSLVPFGPFPYLIFARRLASKMHPDWIIGFSDTYYGIVAEHLARRCGARSLVDAYDNYESYLGWCRPLHRLWRRALRRATVVSAAGPQLASLLSEAGGNRRVEILPMAADPQFVPLDRVRARQDLGLPVEGKLIGYCGALYRNRGIDFLFRLIEDFAANGDPVEFVVSGRLEKGLRLPENVRWLGYLPDDKMPLLLNCMDVLLVLNRESSFGRYSYPVKLYEAMQCHVPVVASDTDAARWILGGEDRFLGTIDSIDDFRRKLLLALDMDRHSYHGNGRWEGVADELSRILNGG